MTPRFFNRELSWIEFNARVLGEAIDSTTPLLERFKFCGIFALNFDEFFMVRVAGLKRRIQNRKGSSCPTGLSPSAQLARIRSRVRELVDRQQELLATELIPGLAEAGTRYARVCDLDSGQRSFAADYFRIELFPLLTPLRVDDVFPFIENLTLHLLVSLTRAAEPLVHHRETFFALIRVPRSVDRFVRLPSSDHTAFTGVEEIVAANAEQLFPGYTVIGTLPFRVTRDADLSVDEERDEDFLVAMEEVLSSRQTSFPVRLEAYTSTTAEQKALRAMLVRKLELTEDDVYDVPCFLDASSFVAMSSRFDRSDLRYPEWPTVLPEYLLEEKSIFDTISEADRVVHHPYESFEPVVRLLDEAAHDPAVLAVKITLYRTSGNSPVVRSLKLAAERGAQVTVFIELKARFDEEQNINWAYELESAGVIVIHGIAHLKVHAKALMIVRRERDGMKRYVHLSTGNYNDSTARLYSDIALFTADDEIAADVAVFFNAITGYSSIPALKRLSMAPTTLKSKLIDLVRREATRCRESGTGRIIAKVNSLADPEIIEALYEASKAGVSIDLNIRGICMLVPGVTGQSENIRVISIVDRYLEHSRIFYFENGGSEELYLSSADLMPRNLERRVELLFPIRNDENRRRIKEILGTYFRDNTKAHLLRPDGTYRRPANSTEPLRAQEALYREAATRTGNLNPSVRKEFTVRRSRRPGE